MFTRCQVRGGLLYPSDQLLFALDVLRAYAERALKENQDFEKPLTSLVVHTVPAMCASKLLQCKDGAKVHRQKLMQLLALRFLKPLLANHAFSITDRYDS
ncbi:hypothetical protein HPB49_005568 [Dermacentor silvarum]|uniref:Uncharacterized protein n=1 Tax=Dermacentor silvarum TaxID=543639 RepID=A0ACB8D310_DERSI|nr:hypothetical protein HPB49_005568 [Dermacentor silvarum]